MPQVLGGNGYIKEYPAERLLRDAKLYEVSEAFACVPYYM
jgi:alkylation response protein AidB-like acyl-CoA dehydrogenase